MIDTRKELEYLLYKYKIKKSWLSDKLRMTRPTLNKYLSQPARFSKRQQQVIRTLIKTENTENLFN